MRRILNLRVQEAPKPFRLSRRDRGDPGLGPHLDAYDTGRRAVEKLGCCGGGASCCPNANGM